MTIEEIMIALRTRFDDQYDVRLVPSCLIGGGHVFRATISNLPRRAEVSATNPYSYRLALNDAYDQIEAD